MFQDLRYGIRLMLKSKLLTAVALLSLSLGIGANTAIFSVVNAVMVRPLAYYEPHRLIKIYQAQPDPAKGMFSSVWAYPRFEILRDETKTLAAVAGFGEFSHNLTGTDDPERLAVETVSASYFPLLGIEAIAGRTFTADEDRVPGANLSALIGHGLWQRRFGGDPHVVGKTLELDKHVFTIVGVLPPGFRGQNGTADAWVTMMAAPLLRFKRTLVSPNNYWFQVVARLKDGVSPQQAQSEMNLITNVIEQRYPGPTRTLPGATKIVTIAPLQATKVDPALKKSFLILLAAVGLVLLIACANVASLLLGRAMARRRELALRLVLGARRGRLIRQLLTESTLLAVVGGAFGVIVARGAMVLLQNYRPSDDAQFWTSYTRTFDFFTISMDWRVLAFNFALALLTGLLFGLIPAIQSSRENPNESLKEGAGSSTSGFRHLRGLSARSGLVIGEIALALMLLVGAGLMIKSLTRLQAIDLGFSPDNVITMFAPSRDAKMEFYDQLLARARSLPGVEAASLGSTAPLLGYSSMTTMEIEGRTGDQPTVGLHSVSPDFFATLEIKVLKGRVFTDQDRIGAPRVAVINRAAADHLFPGEEAIGKRVGPFIDPDYPTDEKFVEIVGIVNDARYGRLEAAVEPDVYLSSLQPTDAAQTLIVRTSVEPGLIVSAMRREALALSKNVPITRIKTMNQRASEVTSRTRFIAALLGLFSLLALLLASIGIYGVMAYNTSARTREIGIRMALGAQAIDVLRAAMKDGLLLIIAGVVLGLAGSWAGARVLKSQLYQVSVIDPVVFLGVAALLFVVAALACYIPARRATKVDPFVALRYE